MIKRVFLIVLDSVGIGEAPDAAAYGDAGSNTLRTCWESGQLHLPNLQKLGLYNIDGVGCGEPASRPAGAFGRMREASAGKDTTIGHWEIGGIISPRPMPTYPKGFPPEIIDAFEQRTGRRVLCNRPYSGTQVILDYGREQMETGGLIVYTSADSVFQVAAHEQVVPLEELYRDCQIARELLVGEHGVGRVIARPFVGEWPHFQRTANRHDFSLAPPKKTILDALIQAGLDVWGVGKINDIFAGRGISRTVRTQNNDDGMDKTIAWAKEPFHGLCFVNLVDFDMLYGHRNDVAGYTQALNQFDRRLGELLSLLGPQDLLMITADHGCDPGTPSTDHSREYVPWLIYGAAVRPGCNLGTRPTFADMGETAAAALGVRAGCDGTALDGLLLRPGLDFDGRELAYRALEARERAYAPYSRFAVGAALVGKGGKLYAGCNLENASSGVTICAERAALAAAVSDGERSFAALAVAGGPQGQPPQGDCFPCGICRQALSEFCSPKMPVLVVRGEDDWSNYTLEELLPHAFRLQEEPPCV